MSTPIPEERIGRKPKLFERGMQNAERGKTEGRNTTAGGRRMHISAGCGGSFFFTVNATQKRWVDRRSAFFHIWPRKVKSALPRRTRRSALSSSFTAICSVGPWMILVPSSGRSD